MTDEDRETLANLAIRLVNSASGATVKLGMYDGALLHYDKSVKISQEEIDAYARNLLSYIKKNNNEPLEF